MDQKTIIEAIETSYSNFLVYISHLDDDQYNYQYADKWSARQQVEHIILCVKPLVEVYGMPPEMIISRFGVTNRPNYSAHELILQYQQKLREGGKAPARYEPSEMHSNTREELCALLGSLIEKLKQSVQNYKEDLLETILIPHPILGPITLKEMLYNAINHVEHHHEQIARNLENMHALK